MVRFPNVSNCNETSFGGCDRSACYTTPSLNCSSTECDLVDLLCIFVVTCLDGFTYVPIYEAGILYQCANGEMILYHEFCDGEINCKDGSDEIRNQPGFKCDQTIDACALPQRNLYDDVAHCDNASDLCHVNHSCFECLDKRLLISPKQVCNGVFDCYDLSDECLCESNFFNSSICNAMFTYGSNVSNPFCSNNAELTFFNSSVFEINPELTFALMSGSNINPSAFFNQTTRNGTGYIFCATSLGQRRAVLCDGLSECRDFSDECECENPASFCNESCRVFYDSFYPFGDYYCDGIEDEFAWEHLDESACPRGFDEKLCPKRFYCTSGDRVSIEAHRVCDDVVNCDNGEDEQNCSTYVNEKLFSSETEMISNLVFCVAFWLNGFLIIVATVLVIARKIKLFKAGNLSASLRCQHTIIVNIALADFVMGVYLLTIAAYSSIYSGYYGQVDVAWRSSLSCSTVGSLAVLSSEASCFLMVVLTAFRLHSTCDPYATLASRMWPWKMAVCASWIIAFILATLPISAHLDFQYFLRYVYFAGEFNNRGFWNASDITKFACRFAALTKQTINKGSTELETTRSFLKKKFPEETMQVFGYYSETSVCMPRFFVARGETAWEYTLIIMTINFLAFMSIAACYIYLYYEITRRSRMLGASTQQRSSDQESKMRKRIATLIGTDFLCWIPICIMSYVRISGVKFSNIVYQVTAVFLLPINSVMNPLIYSLIPETKITKIFCCKKQQRTS